MGVEATGWARSNSRRSHLDGKLLGRGSSALPSGRLHCATVEVEHPDADIDRAAAGWRGEGAALQDLLEHLRRLAGAKRGVDCIVFVPQGVEDFIPPLLGLRGVGGRVWAASEVG